MAAPGWIIPMCHPLGEIPPVLSLPRKQQHVPAWKQAQFNAIFLRAKSSYLRGQHGGGISLLSHFSLPCPSEAAEDPGPGPES